MSTPPKHSGSSRSWRAVAIVVGVIVVAGAAAFFLLHKGGTKGVNVDETNHAIASIPPDVAPVRFRLRNTSTVTTVEKSKVDGVQIRKAAKDIAATLGNMYTVAFTDPDHWKSGDYDTVFGFFATGQPADSAQKDAAVLTLGPDAGDTYDKVAPKYSSVTVKVLTDRGGEPYTAAATAVFTADGTTKDGSTKVIKSHATYYLQRGEGGWLIVAYKARRTDGGAGGKIAHGGGGGGKGASPSTTTTTGASQ